MASNGKANGPIETKVKAAGLVATLTAFVLAVILQKVPMLAPYAEVLNALILALITGGLTTLAGWWAKHTARNDKGTATTGTPDNIPPTA